MDISKPPRIAIIGAGPAGLTLGVLLLRHQIPFTIYELRPRPTEEDFAQPSGMLDLHEDTGLATLSACGLLEQFQSLAVDCSEGLVVVDQNDAVLFNHEGGSGRPEISRHALTKLLLSALPPECVRWEHKLLGVKASDTEHVLDFGPRNGQLTADLVIGADGAWSRTRPPLTDTKPQYSGIHFITLDIPQLDKRFPHLDQLIGPGSMHAPGDGNAILSHRGANGAARFYVGIKTLDENYASSSGFKNKSPLEVRDLLLESEDNHSDWNTFAGFGPKLRELISRGFDDLERDSLDVMPLYMLPLGKLEWQHRAGITLVGDAAHLMTPFAGEGVNLAMKDVLELAGIIMKAWDKSSEMEEKRIDVFRNSLDLLMVQFEAAMIERGERTAALTWDNLQLLFSENAAQKWADLFRTLIPQDDE